ncbi:hypothetical protein [Psychrobacillus sp. L4]
MSFAFIGGILFGAIANYTQSILIPILLHMNLIFYQHITYAEL